MGQRSILDTNIAIYILNGSLPPDAFNKIQTLLQTECNLSIITKMELLGWQFPSPLKQLEAESFVNASTLFYLTNSIADQTILIRRQHKIKLPDAIIAATALVNNFQLITRNDSDFSRINGLNVINPFI